jgi:hypothetical protein
VDEAGRPTEPPVSANGSEDAAADGDTVGGQPEPGSPYASGSASGSLGGTGDLLSGAAATLGQKLGSGRQAMRQAVTATNSWLAGGVARSEPSAAAANPRSAADGSVTGENSVIGGSPTGATTAADVAVGGAAATASGAAAGAAALAARTEADGRRMPSFSAAGTTAGAAGTAAGPAGTATGMDGHAPVDTGTVADGGGQDPASRGSLWRDSYAPQQSASRPASPWSQSYGAAPDVTSPEPAVGGPGAGGMNGAAPGGFGGSARSAATAAGAGLADYAGSVTAAWQNRSASAKRKDSERRNRRQAHLTLARVEPWSVMKFSFVVSVVAFIILFVAIAVLYFALSALGVFTSLQHTVSSITSSQGSAGTNISSWFSASRILGYTGMLGALNIVLITAISTIGAVIYNLIAHTIGGIEVTLRETD